MIYFVYNPTTNLVKIGYSKNVLSRVDALKSKFGHQLELKFVCEGNIKEEKRIHLMFKDYRKTGEWFEWVDEMASLKQESVTPTRRIPSGVVTSLNIDADIYRRVAIWADMDKRSISKAICILLDRQLHTMGIL